MDRYQTLILDYPTSLCELRASLCELRSSLCELRPDKTTRQVDGTRRLDKKESVRGKRRIYLVKKNDLFNLNFGDICN